MDKSDFLDLFARLLETTKNNRMLFRELLVIFSLSVCEEEPTAWWIQLEPTWGPGHGGRELGETLDTASTWTQPGLTPVAVEIGATSSSPAAGCEVSPLSLAWDPRQAEVVLLPAGDVISHFLQNVQLLTMSECLTFFSGLEVSGMKFVSSSVTSAHPAEM